MDESGVENSVRGPLLLSQLKLILDSDPLIDELGFIHPDQITNLHAAGVSRNESPGSVSESDQIATTTLSRSEKESHLRAARFSRDDAQQRELKGQGSPERSRYSPTALRSKDENKLENDLMGLKLDPPKIPFETVACSPPRRKDFHSLSNSPRETETGVDCTGDGKTTSSTKDNDALPLLYDTSAFWCGEHKLAISMLALPPLYLYAQATFMEIRRDYEIVLQAERQPELRTSRGSSFDASSEGDLPDVTEQLNLEDTLLSYSRVLVLVNSDHASAWSTRKRIIQRRGLSLKFFTEELQLATLVLSRGPKSEETWAHSELFEQVESLMLWIGTNLSVDQREVWGLSLTLLQRKNALGHSKTPHINRLCRRWVINQVVAGGIAQSGLDGILEDESKLVEVVARRSAMNYRAWRHRCWLVSQMSSLQIAIELHRSKLWARSHIADNCCFHYRRILLLQLSVSHISGGSGASGVGIAEQKRGIEVLKVVRFDGSEIRTLWKEEMDWIKKLIHRYKGREALWIHLRFLLSFWISHVGAGSGVSTSHPVSSPSACGEISANSKNLNIMESEVEFSENCLTQSALDQSDDGQKQQEYAASYKLWTLALGCRGQRTEKSAFLTTEHFSNVQELLHEVAPYRNQLWDGLVANFQKRSP